MSNYLWELSWYHHRSNYPITPQSQGSWILALVQGCRGLANAGSSPRGAHRPFDLTGWHCLSRHTTSTEPQGAQPGFLQHWPQQN